MNRLLVLSFVFLIIISSNVFGQRTQQRIAVGDNFFEQEQFEEALNVYETVIRRDRSDETMREVSFKIGECYRMLLNYQKAREWYNIASNMGYEDPVVYLRIGEMALGLEDFNGAIVYVGKFLDYDPDEYVDRANKIQESALFSLENYDRATLFEVSYESELASNWQEWGVSFMENVGVFLDDPEERRRRFDITIDLRHNDVLYWSIVRQELKDRIVFASTRPVTEDDPGGFSNIYQATFSRRDGKWDEPIPLGGEINSPSYDAFLSFDRKNATGYFMNCGGLDGTRETCDIYKADYDINRDIFTNIRIFDYNTDDYSIGYPSINENGTVLYFATDEAGYWDIYKVVRDEETNEWSAPINLGPTINTPYNDAYPYIAGNVLYFSSYGHTGFGSFDIFYSEIDEDGNYSEPVNLGAPINSSADDFGFVISDDYSRGFFSSNRPGGSGTDDLYSFRLKVQEFAIEGKMTNKVTGNPVPNIDIYIIGDDNTLFTVNSDSEGYFSQDGLNSDVMYNVEVAPENYMPFSYVVSLSEQLVQNRFEVINEYELNIELEPFEDDPEPEELLVVDEVEEVEEIKEVEEVEEVAEVDEKPAIKLIDYDLPLVYFDFAKHDLRQDARLTLDSVVQYMKDNPDIGIVIHAHTDEVSGYLYNFYLSQMRAKSVIDYMVDRGIDNSRLYPVGHGKMQLIVENASKDSEHQLNRRAHFETVDINNFKQYWTNASRNSFRYLNSIEKDAHYAEGIEFMIQIIAARNPVPPSYYRKIMETYPRLNIIYYYDEDKFHRYLVGSFDNFYSAYNVQASLRELGYEIYLVAFDDGQRISVSRARRILSNN